MFWDTEKKVYVNVFLIVLALAFAGFSSQVRVDKLWVGIACIIILVFAMIVLGVQVLLNRVSANVECVGFKKTVKGLVSGFVLVILGFMFYHLVNLAILLKGLNGSPEVLGFYNVLGIALGALLFLMSFVLMFV